MKDKVILSVHSKPNFQRYNETVVRDNTNCYSHALGSTFPTLQIYRVGAISEKKNIDEKYTSIEEIKELLFLDCKELKLEIRESSLEEEISDEEHKIALFVKIFRNGRIADYHFWRYDNDLLWTEKWRGRGMNKIQNFQRDKLNYFPWNFVGIYKISKQRVQ